MNIQAMILTGSIIAIGTTLYGAPTTEISNETEKDTRIQVIEKNKRVSYTGTIPSLTKDFILIKTTTGHINLKLKDIISIELVEEVLYESA